MSELKLDLTPHRPAVLAGHDGEIHVLVRVAAPPMPESMQRAAPLHLALVIDRSGSMSGKPLDEAKRCAEYVVKGLRAGDRVSLVAFDSEVELRVPADPLGDGRAIRKAIAGIRSGGSTNLHGGWFRGAESLAPHTGRSSLSRVILLSDGCVNHGLQDESAIAAQCRELAEAGISTSTYGLGQNFNESLMQAMARAGGGNAYYGETADDLMDPFREELALLNALVARKLRLKIAPAPGVTVKALNDYDSPAPNEWLLPDLAFGGEAWALLRVRTTRALGDAALDQRQHLFDASLSCETVEGEAVAAVPARLALPAAPAAAFDALARDEIVDRRIDELTAAREAETARSAALRGDWREVDELLARLRVRMTHSPWISGVVGELESLARRRDTLGFSKETAYSSHRMKTRIVALGEHASPDDELLDIPAFLRRKSAQGKDPGPANPKPPSTP